MTGFLTANSSLKIKIDGVGVNGEKKRKAGKALHETLNSN